jgi:hypothetical protein
MRSFLPKKVVPAVNARETLLGQEPGKALSVVQVVAIQCNDGQPVAHEAALAYGATQKVGRLEQPELALEFRTYRVFEIRIKSLLDPSRELALEFLEVGDQFPKVVDSRPHLLDPLLMLS